MNQIFRIVLTIMSYEFVLWIKCLLKSQKCFGARIITE